MLMQTLGYWDSSTDQIQISKIEMTSNSSKNAEKVLSKEIYKLRTNVLAFQEQ